MNYTRDGRPTVAPTTETGHGHELGTIPAFGPASWHTHGVGDGHQDNRHEIDLAADAAARSAVEELARGDLDRRLEAANRLRDATEALILEYVLDARERGVTWAVIGEALGVSTQAVHQRYRHAGDRGADH